MVGTLGGAGAFVMVGTFVVVVVDTQVYVNQKTVASTESGEHCALFIVLFIAPGYK